MPLVLVALGQNVSLTYLCQTEAPHIRRPPSHPRMIFVCLRTKAESSHNEEQKWHVRAPGQLWRAHATQRGIPSQQGRAGHVGWWCNRARRRATFSGRRCVALLIEEETHLEQEDLVEQSKLGVRVDHALPAGRKCSATAHCRRPAADTQAEPVQVQPCLHQRCTSTPEELGGASQPTHHAGRARCGHTEESALAR